MPQCCVYGGVSLRGRLNPKGKHFWLRGNVGSIPTHHHLYGPTGSPRQPKSITKGYAGETFIVGRTKSAAVKDGLLANPKKTKTSPLGKEMLFIWGNDVQTIRA